MAPRWLGLVVVTLSMFTVGCRWLTRGPDSGHESRNIVTRSAVDPEAAFTTISQQIDQPAGNDYLNSGLWKETLDPLPHELSTMLAANGLRVGVIRGNPPTELERLGTSEVSSVGLVQRNFAKNRADVIPLNGPMEKSKVLHTKALPDEREVLNWTYAEYGVEVSVAPAESGYVLAKFLLRVQHGDQRDVLLPNSEGTGFVRKSERPTIQFKKMAWEVKLTRRDIMVFGATEEPAGTLGQAIFLVPKGDQLRQRVFVFQVGSNVQLGEDAPLTVPGFAPSGSVAAQAWRTPRRVRGVQVKE